MISANPVSKVTVCGGGNGAQTLVPIAARNLGCPVDVYAPYGDEAERMDRPIELTGAVDAAAQPRLSSADPAAVIPGSQLVVLVLPAFAHEETLRQVVPHLDRDAWVGAIPARGGFDYCAAAILAEIGREDVKLFGLQTLPWACRIQTFGRRVHVLGVKQGVDAASRPADAIYQLAPLLTRLLGLPVHTAANMLALTLANTGQLIHPGIMYGLFADWDGEPLGEAPLFYYGLDEPGAALLASLSDEVQAVRVQLGREIDLSAVRPLIEWLLAAYRPDIGDPGGLLSAFRTNRAYVGLKAPVRHLEAGGYAPDFTSRYLTEDVPFGLAVSRAIASMVGVSTRRPWTRSSDGRGR